MSRLDHYEWRYVRGGRCTHALKRSLDLTARCGVSPSWFELFRWRGTGSQVEYETAAVLPRCKRCVALIGGTS